MSSLKSKKRGLKGLLRKIEKGVMLSIASEPFSTISPYSEDSF